MDIKFFEYCIVVFGDTREISIDLEAVSEGNIHYLSIGGVYVATFCSAMKVGELKEFFSSMGWNFLLTLKDDTTFGAYLEDKQSFEHLFDKRDYFEVNWEDLKNQLNSVVDSDKTMFTNEEDDVITIERKVIKPSLDELLDKISRKGIKSLSVTEKKFLDEYSS